MKFFILQEGGRAIFINLAHVVKVESDAIGNTLTVRMIDNSAHVVTGDTQKHLRILLTQMTQQK